MNPSNTTSDASRKKQAVLLIHGIGEQRPMDTLRSFVRGWLAVAFKGEVWSYNVPDPLSRLFELRRFTVLPGAGTRTDLYEYYWADRATASTVPGFFGWIWRLVWIRFTKGNKRFQKLRRRTLTVVALLGIVIPAVGIWAFTYFQGPMGRSIGAISLILPAILVLLRRVVSPLAGKKVRHLVYGYLGDAVRYLDSSPSHVLVRQQIRADGIELLKRLQTEGQYDRVIVIGHSLGAIIAYDFIRFLWAQTSQDLQLEPADRQRLETEIEQVEAHAQALNEARAPGNISERRAEFMLAQERLYSVMRELGFKWNITDLVTVGAPLAHAEALMVDDPRDFDSRLIEREFPTCPPYPEPGDGGPSQTGRFSYVRTATQAGEPRAPYRVLHHAAPFAVTRWHNLYSEADLIGGPINPVFGHGAEDIVVNVPKTLMPRFVTDHVRYWDLPGSSSKQPGEPWSLKLLERILSSRGDTKPSSRSASSTNGT